MKYKDDYLYCYNDEGNLRRDYGMHIKGEVILWIPINTIEKIQVINVYDDYDVPEVKEPVYGYKGVTICNGILGDARYIYEIGIPYEEEKRNPYITNF